MFSIEFLCVMLPLCGVITGQALRQNRSLSHIVASSMVGLSSVLSWYLFLTFEHNYEVGVMPWLSIADMSVRWSIYVDRLTTVMLIVVTTVSFVVNVYSCGYMKKDPGAVRFFSYLSAFTFFMMVLVTSGNFLQLFFGWEGVGLCSYLLIGFWFREDNANKSSMKAFVVNRVGDLFFLCGILVVFYTFHSLNFSDVLENVVAGRNLGTISVLGFDLRVADMACVLLFLGCMGKSAQLGLHTWLPDAMAGPTPASALIHAATMVTAGVFLVARNSLLFELSQISRDFILIIGLATCLVAAMIAIVQEDIKKVVAYSTCSQLGYMFVACGTSSYHLAIFHLLTHAFFKSLLFLSAGNVIHSNEGEQRINYISKNCWRDIPLTYALMWIGSLALMGVFPFSGFYSKDLIVESSHGLGFIITNLVVGLTSMYSCRLMLEVFHNKNSKRLPSIHESKKIMLIPMLILAVGSIFSGKWFEHYWGIAEGEFWLNSIKVHEHLHPGFLISLVPSMLVALGVLVYLFYRWGKLPISVPKIFYNVLQNKFYFDELYDHALVRPMWKVSAAFWVFIDQKVIDYFVLGGITGSVDACSAHSARMQSGRVLDYALAALFGVVVAALLVIYGFKVR